jgi:hypothetical protein
MGPGIQDNDTNRIKEGGKAFENWRAGVFVALPICAKGKAAAQ